GANAADRIHADHATRADMVQGPDVGAVVHAMRRDRVRLAVPREECDAAMTEAPDHEAVRSAAVGRVDRAALDVGEPGQAVESGAADQREVDAHASTAWIAARLRPCSWKSMP